MASPLTRNWYPSQSNIRDGTMEKTIVCEAHGVSKLTAFDSGAKGSCWSSPFRTLRGVGQCGGGQADDIYGEPCASADSPREHAVEAITSSPREAAAERGR